MTEPLDFKAAEPDDVLDAFARRLAEPLKSAPRPDTDFANRVMTQVRAEQRLAATSAPAVQQWWRKRWQLSVSPIGALGTLAAAAAVTFIVRTSGAPTVPDTAGRTDSAAMGPSAPSAAPAMKLVRFELSAEPGARVSLVGAFNGWDREATHLVPVGTADATGKQRYVVQLELPRGRHEYAFVLGDSTWTNDPAATVQHRDEFGTRTSVVVVDAPPSNEQTRRQSSS